jgi:methionine-rich copper-binding protein CopC
MSGRSRRQRKNVYFMAVLLTAAVMAGILMWFHFMKKGTAYRDEDFFDPAAEAGILSDMQEQDIQDKLDQVVEDGMLDISISSGITFQNGTSSGQADICNAETNRYNLKTAITLEKTGETVFESEEIPPGQKISSIQLNRKLKAGEYPATAVFTAYTRDTHQIVGITGAHIMLYVEQ